MTDSVVCTKYVRVAVPTTVDVALSTTPRKREKFGMVPVSILCHPELTYCARVVYGLIRAHSFGNQPATIGIRRMAQMLNSSTRSIQDAICNLKAVGCLSVSVDKLTKRNIYSTLHVPIIDEVVHRKAKPQLLKCAECHKPRVLGKTGWCKACAAKRDSIRTMEGVVMRMVGERMIA